MKPKHLDVKLNERQLKSFWAKVEKGGPEDCWMWTASVNVKGYGKVGITEREYYTPKPQKVVHRTMAAHRVSWILANGPVPEGMLVLHKCVANRLCVNPAHLKLGTVQENAADMVEQGRAGSGFEAIIEASAKLTEEQVLEIAELLKSGEFSHRELAKRYGVTHPTIGRIGRGERWTHVTGDETRATRTVRRKP